MHYCVGEQNKLKNIKFYLFTNCQILLWKAAKQAKIRYKPQELKIQTVFVLTSLISIYNCVGKQSKLKNFK